MSSRSVVAPKVLFLAGRDPTEEIGGGHSSFVRATARAATALGCDVKIYCVSSKHGNQICDFGLVRRVPHKGRPCRQTEVAFHAPTLIAAATADQNVEALPALIHSFGVWGHVGHQLHAQWLGSGFFVPHLISMYTVYEEEALAQLRATETYHVLKRLRQWLEWRRIRKYITPLEHEALLGADAVAVNYESVRKLLACHHDLGNKAERIKYSPESAFTIDSENRLPLTTYTSTLKDGRPLITAITLQKPKKGIDKLLYALALLRKRGLNFRACVVGGGPLLKANRRLAQQLKLTEHVTFAGLVPDVLPYLKAADIFVLPSLREESGSLAVLEAMQAGCAIVASGVDGILEDICHGTDGLLVEPGNVNELADAIESLIKDPARRELIGTAARRTFEHSFSANAHVQGLCKLYHRLGVPIESRIYANTSPAMSL
jgi:glycosyltransferase involved in cell wall biosynthesis